MVIEGSNEVEPETEAASSVTVSFFKDTPDFKLTNHVFGKDTLFSQSTVVGLLRTGERLTLPAFMRGLE